MNPPTDKVILTFKKIDADAYGQIRDIIGINFRSFMIGKLTIAVIRQIGIDEEVIDYLTNEIERKI